MAYNTKNIIRDAAGAPIPQVYNPAADAYEVLQGRNGANRVELYGPDGNPISTTDGTLLTQLTGSNLQNNLANAVPIKYPYFEKRYTQYDDYSLAAGAAINFNIWADVQGYRRADLIVKKQGSNSFLIELYNRSLVSTWYVITTKTGTTTDLYANNHPIMPQTGIYIRNDGTTEETITGIAVACIA